MSFVQHHVIENDEPTRACDDLPPHVFPHSGAGMMPDHVAVDRIMAEALGVFSKVRDRIIDLAAQQKLAVIQARNFVSRLCVHRSIMSPSLTFA